MGFVLLLFVWIFVCFVEPAADPDELLYSPWLQYLASVFEVKQLHAQI